MIAWYILTNILAGLAFFPKTAEHRASGKFLLVVWLLASSALYANGINPNEVD